MGNNSIEIMTLVLFILSIYCFINAFMKARAATMLLKEIKKTVEVATKVQKDAFEHYAAIFGILNKVEESLGKKSN